MAAPRTADRRSAAVNYPRRYPGCAVAVWSATRVSTSMTAAIAKPDSSWRSVWQSTDIQDVGDARPFVPFE